MKLLLLASAGGALGAGARFLISQAFASPALVRGVTVFPWPTFAINVAGSFLMGLAVVIIAERFGNDPETRTFFMTGILGGFTTFSAFSLEAFDLFVSRTPRAAAAYVIGSVVVSIGGLIAGMWIARAGLVS
jgi:fluoride exporter